MKKLSLVQARRIALAAQGFCDQAPKAGVTIRHFRRAMGRMNILQLDAVNVLCRSHFLPIFARLGPYDKDSLDQWLWRSGDNHEFIAHEASITTMNLYPLLRHRMNVDRWKSGKRFCSEQRKYLKKILADIERRGALSVKDIKDAGDRTGPWWGWSKGKIGLEVLYRTGQVAIAERTKTFLTHYDLSHRVVPQSLRSQPAISKRDAQREMLRLAARSHGVGTDKDLADYYRIKITEARPLLVELACEGLLQEVVVEGWNEPTYLSPDAKRPRSVKARALLSPFDPLVWFRPRAERLFGFRYRIEIYVPEAKRQYGYYVLPFLLGDKLVGRVDLKAARKEGVLLAKAAYLEPGCDKDEVAHAMAKTLHEMAAWLGLDAVKVLCKGDLAAALRAAKRTFAA